MINKDEVCFIILAENDTGFDECRERIIKLDTPTGIRITYAKLVNEHGNVLSMINNATNTVPSRYKVYLWQDAWIIQKDFLRRAISFFREHPDYGILGVQGAKVKNSDFSEVQMLGAFYGVLEGHLKRFSYLNEGDGCMEADILNGMIVITQYDVPCKPDLFSSQSTFAASQAIEFKRHGYRVGVFSQEDPWLVWCSEFRQFGLSSYDKWLLSVEYGEDLSQGISPIWKNYNYSQTIETLTDIKKKEIVDEKNSNHAAVKIWWLGNMMFKYNQKYTDDFLENQLLRLESLWGKQYDGRDYVPNKGTVLFYDGFGLDTRGLAQIYLDAIGEAGWHILYIVEALKAEGKIPILEALLKKYNADIVYLPSYKNHVDAYQSICETIYTYRPECGFLYIVPADISAILAFMHFAGKMRRYQINLTDHAFWLGRNAFDYCLEFRDYGAAISGHCRRIPKEKLAYMPYYPAINKDIEFQGFPFEKNDDDFVIFSGGSLYKTIDKDGTYYRIVDRILEKHPQVKFWYAGSGDEDSHMKKLLEKWPGRVFFTPERKDLYSLMKHLDMYLNTYPIGGGLMVQYSAAAGKVPMSLVLDESITGLLLIQGFGKIMFNDEKNLLAAVTHFIEDDTHRKTLEELMQTAILTRDDFRKQMIQVLKSPRTYEAIPSLPETSDFRRKYFDRFLANYVIATSP